MSDLTLGPVIGTFGGGGEPLVVPITDPREVVVALPEGEWCVTLQANRFISSQANGRFILYEDGERVTDASGSQVNDAGTGVASVRRHRSGTITYTSPNVNITSVICFPDPTP